MKELISIIVPVYNTEAYLQECIQSVLKQTYRHWELLLVDDGSTDKSGEICESYAADDNRIKVFHQNNAGQSKARNTALEFCEGKYYTFLDSDDRLSEDALEILYTSMRNTDSDISCGGGFSFGNRTRKAVCMPDGKYVLNAEEACRRMFIQDGLNSNTVAKLYRAHLWNQVKFPENHIFEDVPIMYKIVLNSNQVSFCDRYVYEQRSRAGSTTRKDWSDERKIYVTYSQAVYEDIKQRLPQMAEEAFVYYLTAVIDNYIHVSLSRNNKDYREYREELYRTIKENDAIVRKYPCLRRMRKRIIVCKLGLGGGTKRYLFKTKIGKRKRRYNMDIKGKVKNRGGISRSSSQHIMRKHI